MNNPAQQTAHDIAILVAGIDSKLQELQWLICADLSGDASTTAWNNVQDAHDALTRVLAETKAAVEVGR
jgi:hypothetical protein